ncbi:MAG: DUF4252 domain-containing protein [Bacteroidaceae bacterium]|nr:DUF4252 domain-containing protein [Bacteroidaceae bacterium]
MKKILLLAAAVLLLAAQGAAQTLTEIYDAFRGKPGVELVEISGRFLLDQLKAQLREQVQAQLADTTSLDSAGQAELRRQLEEEYAREIDEAFSDTATGGDEQLRVLRNIDSLVVMNLEAPDCSAELLAEFEAKTANLKSLGYEVLVNSNEGGEKSQVLMRTDDEGTVTELLVRHIEQGEAQLVLLVGRFKDDDWSKVINFDNGGEGDDEDADE